MLVLLFVLMLPGYFSQEPNEARVMVFFGEYKGTFKNTGFFWVNPFINKTGIDNQGSCPKIKKFRNTSAGNITKLKNKAINPLITSSL